MDADSKAKRDVRAKRFGASVGALNDTALGGGSRFPRRRARLRDRLAGSDMSRGDDASAAPLEDPKKRVRMQRFGGGGAKGGVQPSLVISDGRFGAPAAMDPATDFGTEVVERVKVDIAAKRKRAARFGVPLKLTSEEAGVVRKLRFAGQLSGDLEGVDLASSLSSPAHVAVAGSSVPEASPSAVDSAVPAVVSSVSSESHVHPVVAAVSECACSVADSTVLTVSTPPSGVSACVPATAASATERGGRDNGDSSKGDNEGEVGGEGSGEENQTEGGEDEGEPEGEVEEQEDSAAH